MEFIKYHGLGNDFILLKGGMGGFPAPTTDEVTRLCHRRRGIGADGILLARPSEQAQLRMEIINSDGSIPEMCGNGIRCLVKYAIEELGLESNPLDVETTAGVLSCRWSGGVDEVSDVQVSMGPPDFRRSALHLNGDGDATDLQVVAGGATRAAVGVSMGNPHMVIFSATPLDDARALGQTLSVHPDWTSGANVEFVQVVSPTHLNVVVWERGCGMTQACGTGATAAAAAAVRQGHCPADTPLRVSLPGGDLTIRVAEDFHQSWMEGPARRVYEGSWNPRE